MTPFRRGESQDTALYTAAQGRAGLSTEEEAVARRLESFFSRQESGKRDVVHFLRQ